MKQKKNKKSFFSFEKNELNLLKMKDRPRLMLLILLGVVFFLLWWFLLMEPWVNAQDKFGLKVKAMQQQIKVLDDQRELLITKHSEGGAAISGQHKKLNDDIKKLNENLGVFADDIVSPEMVTHLLKDSLGKQSGLTLSSLKSRSPERLTGKNAKDKHLFENNINLAFHGNYFSTINYLEGLKKTPWRIFWDSLDYRVTNYPDAKINLKFHVISEGEKQ
jgi:MSHA biogenesis protein MshJ